MFEDQVTSQERSRPTVVQRRRVERVQAILDAAEALLGEQGYEAATLKAIGERAGIPTASVYHYFADRQQVDAELLQHHLRELETRLGATLEERNSGTLRDAIDAVTDACWDYLREHPSCGELWFTGHHAAVNELVRVFDETQAERSWHFLVERELLPPDTPHFVLQLAFEAGRQLFDAAFRHSPTGDDTIINESKRLVTAYLETYAA